MFIIEGGCRSNNPLLLASGYCCHHRQLVAHVEGKLSTYPIPIYLSSYLSIYLSILASGHCSHHRQLVDHVDGIHISTYPSIYLVIYLYNSIYPLLLSSGHCSHRRQLVDHVEGI